MLFLCIVLSTNSRAPLSFFILYDQSSKNSFSFALCFLQDLDHPNICKLLETYEQGRLDLKRFVEPAFSKGIRCSSLPKPPASAFSDFDP